MSTTPQGALSPDVVASPPGTGFGDAVTLLSVYIVLLFAIPSRLVVAPLGGAGSPANLAGAFGGLWWVWYHLHRSSRLVRVPTPVRRAVWLFCLAVVASYVAAMSHPIVAAEVSTADLGLVALVGWAGVALVAHDGIADRTRLETILGRLVVAGGIVALLGVVQFVTKQAWIDQIAFPGLVTNAPLNSVLGRDGFTRPAGTSIHPIEFGVVLTMVLPIALHRAFYRTALPPVRRWWPTLAIALAIPLSISRSALLGAAAVLVVLLPTWPPVRRRLVLVSIGGLVTLIFVMIPRMIGTLTSLFTGIGQDSSAQSRSDSYGLAFEFAARNPIIGRGFSTFLPSYRILDNEYLLLLIEVGVVGLSAMVAVLVTAFVSARRARRVAVSAEDRDLCQALAASVTAAAVSLALFDALSFPMAAGLLFLATGIAGSLERVLHQPASRREGGVVA